MDLNNICVAAPNPRATDLYSSFTKQTQSAIQIQTMLLGVVRPYTPRRNVALNITNNMATGFTLKYVTGHLLSDFILT